MKIFKYLFITAIAVSLNCCKMVEPEDEGQSRYDRVLSDPSFGEGFLMRGYGVIPTNNYRYDEVATDDAVSNSPTNSFRRMAIGEWTAFNNPQNVWTNVYEGIMYVNKFFEIVDELPYRPSEAPINDLFKFRLRGEAYAVRSILKYYLLLYHAGVGADGRLLGTPIYDQFIDDPADFAKPRATFIECVNSIYADIDKAMEYLPFDYQDITNLDQLEGPYPNFMNQLQNTYRDLYQNSDPEKRRNPVYDYNFVCGNYTKQRLCGRILVAFRARMALLHASPAYNEGNNELWRQAAQFSGQLLNDIGGVSQLEARGHEFYLAPQVAMCDVAATGGGSEFAEIIWRKPRSNESGKERDNFPPSIYGSGRINPSQNLVEAFPMANGYPIGHSEAGYDPNNPYQDRDPRLDLYILRNGGTMKNAIWTESGNGATITDDNLNRTVTSTRTGYYLRKLLREDAVVGPGNTTTNQLHVDVWIRYTEMFLTYAEAANEIWGPDGDPTSDFSPRSIIGAIRARAGIEAPDPYLASINTKEEMRQLIQNERRLELCFEGFRFWDIRRWGLNMNETVRGVRIENDGTNRTYHYFDVEQRAYGAYQQYGPIPRTEVVKYNLVQNRGW